MNNEIINKLLELYDIKIYNNDEKDSLGISINTLKSLDIIDDISELEKNKNIRELYYNYIRYLKLENYIECEKIIKKIKDINYGR
ncbi:MAG: hypothetical protein WDA02_08445 [Saccharofermentanales bacterium]|jgi:DNA topoisomerase VI subunit A